MKIKSKLLSTKTWGPIIGEVDLTACDIKLDMRKPKTVKYYSFKDMSKQDMVDMINHDLPISLRKNEDLISRIHDRYPLIDKSQVSLIVKTVFQSMRELMLLGKVLSFHSVFFDTKLHFYLRNVMGVIKPSLKVKIATPPPLKKI
jgi:hypothetical protein